MGGSLGGETPSLLSGETSALDGDKSEKIKSVMVRLLTVFHHKHLPPALTSIRGHLPEGGGPAGADAHRQGFADRLLQVGQTGSQSLAQPVAGAGVAPVARLGEVVHEGPPRRLRHGSFPAARMQSRLLNMQKCHPMSVTAAAFNYTGSKISIMTHPLKYGSPF